MLSASHDKYFDWMNERNARGESPLNKCAEWTQEMLDAFPELTRVRGNVLLSSGYERPHWWLTTPDGQILDPTSNQFCGTYYGGAWITEYQPHDESKGEPKGRCMNCGEISWYESVGCSPRCMIELDDYYGDWIGAEMRAKCLAELAK